MKLSQQGQAKLSNHKLKLLTAFVLALFLSACSDSGETPAVAPNDALTQGDASGNDDSEHDDSDANIDVNDPLACGPDVQKQWAFNSMSDYYLFYDNVRFVDPQDQNLETASQIVSRMIFTERDKYSFVSDAAQSDLRYVEGREFGLGLQLKKDSIRQRIIRVDSDSPAGRAGIERGDAVISIDGIPWSDLVFDDSFYDKTFGDPARPGTATWKIQKYNNSEEVLSLELTAAEFKISSVDLSAVFTNPDVEPVIGYLALSSFLEPTKAELAKQFEYFKKEQITELILDLRYNTGGRVSVARYLASLVAGNALAGQLFYEFEYNDKNLNPKASLLFESTDFGLGLSRVVVLTTKDTASASEIVVGGLQPYIDVIIFGDESTAAPTTIGQPFVSLGEDRCGERLNISRAEGFNAERSSVAGGLTAQCSGQDDITLDFASNIDDKDMLWKGIYYLVDGTCTTSVSFGEVDTDYRVGRLFELPIGGAQLD